jgi:hypothetical protein
MSGDPPHPGWEGGRRKRGRDVEKTRRLLASVEELRALLAPLTPEEREQVLALARRIKEQHPDRPDQ